MFLLNGVMFFVTCFFITQKRREKGEDLRLLYFSAVSLLFILTFTSCLSSLYHPNVLRSKLNALPLSVLHSGFGAESRAHHINLMMSENSYWGTNEPHHTFLGFFFFVALTNVVSLHTRSYTRWEKLIDLLRPAHINPEKNLINQSIATVN